MIDSLVNGWWQIIALLVACLVVLWGAAFAIIFFISRAKASGVEEITAGPVKLDFEDDKK
jgi:hypothetical protein